MPGRMAKTCAVTQFMQSSGGKELHYSYITEEETEAQKGPLTALSKITQLVAEQGLKPSRAHCPQLARIWAAKQCGACSVRLPCSIPLTQKTPHQVKVN